MSITSALLNAQRRPEAEAQRFTEAVSRALTPEDEDHAPNVDATIAAEEAFDRTSEEIAEEKAPRRAAPPSGYMGEFTESEPSSFDDDEPLRAATHRLSSHYQLDDTPAAEPELGPAIEPEFASEPLGEEPASEPDPGFEPAPEQSTVPWAPDSDLRERGFGVATPEAEAPIETPSETGSLAPLVAPPLSNTIPPQNGTGPLGSPGAAPVDPVNPADLSGAEEPVDEAEPGEGFDQGVGEEIDGAPTNDLTANAIDGLSTGSSTDADAPVGPAPTGSPSFEWDRPASNVWGDAEELDPSVMASEPVPAPAAEDSAVTVPTADTSETETEEGEDRETDSDPVPSSHATAPPKSLEAPEPEPEPSLVDRIRGALTLHNLRRQVTEPKQALKIGLAVVAVIVIIVVVALSFMGGGRGEPTTPAGTVAPPPSAGENTATQAKDVTLVPATVSASCGNDSDSVAPFSGDKTRAWVCKRINGLDLNVLNITFNKPVVITSITTVPGFNYVAPDGRDEWSRHRLVTAVSWRMGGKVYPQNIAPTRTGVTKQFDSVITQEMSMTITGSTRPPVGQGQNKGFGGAGDANDPKKIDENTAISQIVITGHPVDPGSGAAPGALQPGN